MTNLELLKTVSEEEINIANDFCTRIDKMHRTIMDFTGYLRNLYLRPIDNYTILRYRHNNLNNGANELECLTDEEIHEINTLFDIGMIDENTFGNTNWDYNDPRECWKQRILRRDITKEEKLIFLIYLNKIHNYRYRFQLINIYFTQKHDEEERNDLIASLVEEFAPDPKLKERKPT